MSETKNEISELSARVRQYEHLFWLAAEDVVFFSHYDMDWDNRFHAAVNCGDTFFYATADAEDITPGQAEQVRDFYERYGWAGVVAWVAKKRGIEPLKYFQDEKYDAAMAELSCELGVVGAAIRRCNRE
jgi:hypothetical protein